jgi:ABC-type transporter Mla subunit MlaD
MCREPEALGELAGELRPIMLQLAAAAAQLRRLQQDLEEWTPRELEQQTERLLRKAEDHDDPVARETLEQAAESLRAQMAALTRIDRGRQRVLARLHADVALLERLRFSLIQLRASAAEPAGVPGHTTARLDGLREGLDALQEGLDATVSTLSEVADPARALSRSHSG